MARAALAQEPLLDCQIAECEDMRSARSQVLHHSFDLIVLDTSIEDVRWMAATARDAAIVFLSPAATPAEQAEAVAAGAIDCFAHEEYNDNPSLLWTVLRQSIRYHAIRQQRKQLADLLRDRDIRVVQLTQKLWRISPYDYRTGWFNQNQILDRLNEELRRAKRYRIPISVALLEFVDFAKTEEQLGPDGSGPLFAQLAQRVRLVTRSTDIVGHYGLDACLFLLTNTSKNGAMRFCERLGRTLREPVLVAGTPATLDWRFAVVENDLGKELDPGELLQLAEARVEQAKTMPETGAIVADSA